MSYQSSWRPTSRRAGPPAATSRLQRPATYEVRLVEADELAEADLERAVVLLRVHRVARGCVVDLEHDQPGLEPRDVERVHSRGPDRVRLAGGEQGVPHLGGGLGRDPQLVAEVARVARPADVDLDPGDLRRPAPEVAQVAEVLAARRLEDGAAVGALERERGDRLGHVLDGDVEPRGVHRQPAVLRVGGGPAQLVLGHPVDRAVVDDLAVLVAPRGVDDLADLEPRGVARHDPVGEAEGVGTRDPVLVERADVDDGGRLADRVVLDVVEVGVCGRGEVAGPLAPLHLHVQRRGPGMERGADAQRSSSSGFGARVAGREPATLPAALPRRPSPAAPRPWDDPDRSAAYDRWPDCGPAGTRRRARVGVDRDRQP